MKKLAIQLGLVCLLVVASGCQSPDNVVPNDLPTASAGPDQSVLENSNVILDGSASSDSDGSISSYAWEQTAGPNVSLLNSDQAIASFTAPDVTESTVLSFTLTVTDDKGNRSSDSVNITVNPPITTPPTTDPTVRNRYQMNNQCFAIQALGNNQYIARSGGGYSANAAAIEVAEAFYLKPAALGYYLIYDRAGQVMTNDGGTLSAVSLLDAVDGSTIEIKTADDTQNYPPVPKAFVEPTPEEISAYRSFVDALPESDAFVLTTATGANVANNGSTLTLAAAAPATSSQQFAFVAIDASNCKTFPEAQNNTVGETFSGKTDDGRVLGMTDAHVHISATDFLGEAEWGTPFHQHGVLHALGEDCEEYHGPNGSTSVVEAAFSQDPDGHDTTGWPTFPEWPARNNLFHEAIYWKWLERAWMAGLRVVVNDLVDNETLCELSRNVAMKPNLDCNSMNNAGRQAGTMYAMQDYIDAQYGGRGEGWYQITHDPSEARAVIEDGKIAVVLGIEISNFLNCKVNYGLTPTEEPFEETGTGGPANNTYSCKTTETGADDEILTQIQRIKGWGVRQVITIHEFDNAFGGNGIFGGLILNLGNREDTGAIPGGALANPSLPGTSPENPLELPSGQFWVTYDCPEEGGSDTDGNAFSGYLWGNQGGDNLNNGEPTCPYLGQGGRPGGPTPCYPDRRQCNARWLTPIGLYTYSKIMENGLIFDIDHLEMEMKTQALELAEAQDPPYPFVSTHGTFGGTSVEQAQRILSNAGFLYPSVGNGTDLLSKMRETRGVHTDSGTSELFGFGFGTDTNGLSGQAAPRNTSDIQAKPITYPYVLFEGALFDDLDDFDNIDGVTFQQPSNYDDQGNGRSWHIDIDGSAHYGMLSGMVAEIVKHGTAEELQALFNSAERYLRTWQATLDSQAGILAKTQNDTDGDGQGNAVVPSGVLRPAPVPVCELGHNIPDLTDPACVLP